MNSLILENGQKAGFFEPNATGVVLVNESIRQIKEIKIGNTIKSLIFGDEKSIIIGDKVSIDINNRKVIYNVNYIIKTVTEGAYLLKEFKDNESKFFLTPIYGGLTFNWFYNSYFINAYQSIKHTSDWKYNKDKIIYLMYRFSPHQEFLDFENNIMLHKDFLCKYDKIGEEDRFVVYLMSLEEKFFKDIKLLNKGKYKQLSDILKERIVRFHQLKKDSYMYKVLYDDDSLRTEMESELNCLIPKNLSLRTKPNLIYEHY